MDKLTEKTVLVVDDDPGQRGLIEAFLLGQGFRVETAKSGAEAQARLAEGRPGMLISDVRMPGMTGLELLERVTKTHPGLPMLLVTAYPEIRDAVGAMRNGALDYAKKLLSSVEDSLTGVLVTIQKNKKELN